jgi:DNA-binding beta-propeller fold protein YncE
VYGAGAGLKLNGIASAAFDSAGTLVVPNVDNHCLVAFVPGGAVAWRLGKLGKGKGEFNFPKGVSFLDQHGGALVVADGNNDRVQWFDGATRTHLRSVGTEGTGPLQFDGPVSACETAAGNVAVADVLNHRLVLLTAEGKHLRTFGSQGKGEGQFNTPVCVALARSGRLLVADSQNNRVVVVTEGGAFVRTDVTPPPLSKEKKNTCRH